jgi:hypothetical protein
MNIIQLRSDAMGAITIFGVFWVFLCSFVLPWGRQV